VIDVACAVAVKEEITIVAKEAGYQNVLTIT
jgi:hypothetical protein